MRHGAETVKLLLYATIFKKGLIDERQKTSIRPQKPCAVFKVWKKA